MKKLFYSIVVISIFMLLASVGFGCGDDSVSSNDKTAPAAKCEYTLEVNNEVYPVDGMFYLPGIDAFVVRKPDLSEFTISRDTVAVLYIHK